jgi:parallel beta-helix repeat protein
MTFFKLHTLVFCFVPTLLAAKHTPALPTQNLFNVRAFGAVGDGVHLDTSAIAAAIKAAAAAGGGTVVFTPGTYRAGTFEILSNVSLDLEPGSILQASADISDYMTLAQLGFFRVAGEDTSGDGDIAGFIVARGATNIAIFGHGIIDGNGDSFFDFHTPHYGMDFDPQYTRGGQAFLDAVRALDDGPVAMKPAGRPGTLIFLANASGIVIRDITIRNAPNWTMHIGKSAHAVVSGLRIANNQLIPNNDGIDVIGSHDIHFSDCDIVAGDDDFAIMSSENVTAVNCTLSSYSAGIRLEDTRYATFDNLTIHSNRGIGVFERGRGWTHGVLFSNVVIQTRLLTGHWWGKAEPIYIATAGTSKGVNGVHFSNIDADGESGMMIYGSPGSPIRDVTFDQVRVRIHAPRDAASRGVGGNFDLRWTAKGLETAVFKHDTAALYCRWVDSLKLHGLTVEWDTNLPDYFSSAVECEDFQNIDIDGFSGRQAASAEAVIVLRHGDGVTIRNSTAASGASTFLATSEVSQEGLFFGNDLKNAKAAFAPAASEFTVFGNLLPK